MSLDNPTILSFDHNIHAIDTEFADILMMDASHLIVDNGEAALVDVGSNFSIPVILSAVDKLGIPREQIRYVCVTHVHLDHAGGAGLIMQELPQATLVVHPRGARHMADPSALYEGARQVYGDELMQQHYGELIPVPEERILVVRDGDTLTLGQRSLTFLDTPGHALHHYCVHDSAANAIFSGDTFGIAYLSLTSDKGRFIFPAATPVQFDPAKAHASIDRLVSYQPSAIYLTHFSQVTEIETLANDLHQALDAYAEIGLRHVSATDDRYQAIRADLRDWFASSLAGHGIRLNEKELEEQLGMDINLNAQGIAVWAARQARKAVPAG